MWRPKPTSAREVLRLGRLAVERWQDLPGGLVRIASYALPADASDRFPKLCSAIEALFAEPGDAPVTVVMESAWVPLLFAETGHLIWRRAETESLLRHRFGMLYDETGDSVSDWDLRLDHRAGDSHALGYGLSPHLRRALVEAETRSGRRWSAWMPSWVWAWHRTRPSRQWTGRAGHWAWQEQDRMLLGSFAAGRLVALNPAAKLCGSSDALLHEVGVHCVRSGLQADGWSVAATTWDAAGVLPVSGGLVRWQCLGLTADAAAPIAKEAA